MALAGGRSAGGHDRSLQTGRLYPRRAGIRAAFAACLSAAVLGGAGQGLALSCQPWTHMHAWADAAASDKLYLIVRGDLVFDERGLPQTDWDDQAATPQMTRIEGFIVGEQLGRNGFLRPYEAEVTLEVSCYGPWCAGAVSDERYVAFLEMRDGELVLETNPCGGFLFPATEQIEEDLIGCMRGDACVVP